MNKTKEETKIQYFGDKGNKDFDKAEKFGDRRRGGKDQEDSGSDSDDRSGGPQIEELKSDAQKMIKEKHKKMINE